jgi:hypothetical protein
MAFGHRISNCSLGDDLIVGQRQQRQNRSR